MKPNFMRPTSYSPFARNRTSSSPETDRVLKKEMERQRVEHDAMFRKVVDQVRNLTVVSVAANRTGNKVDVKVRLGGRTQTFHVCTEEYSNSQPRTAKTMYEECLRQLAEKIDVHGDTCSGWSNRLTNVIQKSATENLKGKYEGWLSLATFDVEVWFCDHVLDMNVLQGMEKVFSAYQAFMAKGGVEKNRNAHQGKRALDAVRNAAAHAFNHGLDIEDIVTAVRETLVQGVLES